MREIAIVTAKLDIGGCEKALVSMLKYIPKERYNITIFVREIEGSLAKELPTWIRIKQIYKIDDNSKNIIKYYFKKKEIFKIVISSYYLVKLKYSKKNARQNYYSSKLLPQVEQKFDVAISYFMPGSFAEYYVSHCMEAKQKICWIHSDVKQISTVKDRVCRKVYKGYDYIFGVCNDVSNHFQDCFPELKDKVATFYNIINQEEIIDRANQGEGFSDHFEGVRILTVGRLSKEKGQWLIPNIVLRLKLEGINVRWYCIGEGTLKEILQKEAVGKGIEENLILLGSKENPYPYMRECDIYVQPSQYEGYCTTVEEARCFSIPIIMTQCTGAREQVINNQTGFIVEQDETEIYTKLKELIIDTKKRQQFKICAQQFKIDTRSEMDKLYSVIDRN